MSADFYASAVRDETWIGGVRIESRLSVGEARQSGNEIVAAGRLQQRALLDECDAEAARVREVAREIRDARVRIVVRATSDEPLIVTMTVAIGGASVVTTPRFAIDDASMLRRVLRGLPSRVASPSALVWKNGSAAVLLHEAAGHAAEHGHPPLQWPEWLRVRDGDADLLAGQPPRALRRETFRDVPLPRMTNVVVSQHGAPFAVPDDAVEIDLVSGGSYEPLTEMVTIEAAVPRMTIRATRQEIARSIIGASGPPLRYPGVICSREGQELFVGSHAPLLVTRSLG